MGLNMCLNKKIYIGAECDFNEITGVIDIKKKGETIPINFKKVTYIVEEAVYWRKANQIHKWFVDNIQNGVDDGGEYYVSKEDIQKLLETINTLFDEVNSIVDLSNIDFYEIEIAKFNKKINEHRSKIDEICQKLLPSQSGCFYGGTPYDYFYFYDLDRTKTELKELLKEDDKHFHYYYHASW